MQEKLWTKLSQKAQIQGWKSNFMKPYQKKKPDVFFFLYKLQSWFMLTNI